LVFKAAIQFLNCGYSLPILHRADLMRLKAVVQWESRRGSDPPVISEMRAFARNPRVARSRIADAPVSPAMKW
jgi:hypothetical protein